MDDPINICGRCLIVANQSMLPGAKVGTGGIVQPSGSKPAQIIHWAVDLISRHHDGVTFYDPFGSPGAVRAVSTWHGDLVCALHLYDRVTEEWRVGHG